MNCKEFREKVADLFDKTIDMQTERECKEHMDHCPDCKDYYNELQETYALLQPETNEKVKAEKPMMEATAKSSFFKVASIFIAAIFLTGLSFAAGLSYATYRFHAPKQETKSQEFANEKMLELTDNGERIIITWLKGTWIEGDFGGYIEADPIEHSPALPLYGEYRATILLNGKRINLDNLPDLPASAVNKMEIRFAAGRIVNLITTPVEIPYTNDHYGE
ncbi:MAG: zf-HC2 domain-containing protein [Bacteroidaceae bacterium]|jgi:hypothetical protein|nr:zf-HC2 domain-containing protein [Bacteroidaceae bacterium]